MRFDIISIFPDFFPPPLSYGVTGRAAQRGLVETRAHDLRNYTDDVHRTTDDAPYGGGCGMVMKVEPVSKALRAIRGRGEKGRDGGDVPSRKDDTGLRSMVILTTPQGRPLTQALAVELSALSQIIIICGRYEGVDERIRDLVDMEVSIGDYILTGGEIPALVLIDAVTRLIPGVLGSNASKDDDSFSAGLLEYPQYTRPPEFEGKTVPEVLQSGDHGAINRYRRKESLRRTLEKRPDLLKGADISALDRELIAEIKNKEKA